MLDCLIIGMNEFNYENYIRMVRSLGEEKPPYRDLNLNFVEYEGKAYRGLDLINHFNPTGKKLHNWDFLWPVVLYLGTYLTRHGYTMDYVNHFHLEKEKLKDKLTNNEILTVAITTTLAVIPHPVMEIIQFVRRCNPGVKIIVGGPYILNQVFKELYNIKDGGLTDNSQVQNFFKLIGADYYIISAEGEKALVELIGALKNNTPLDTVNNIAYKKENRFIMTEAVNEFNPLEDNMIDYKRFPPSDFGHYILTRTGKSCPFRCAFCDFPLKAGKYSYLNPGIVEKELNAIEEIGTIKDVSFVDDTLNVPRDRFKEILKIMIKNKYSFKWNSYLRCSHMDEETVQLMKESGCEGVFLGIESGSDAMLERMNKRTRSDTNKKYIRLLKEAGIITHANFIVGFPGETGSTIRETIEFIEDSKPDFFRAQLWYADPTTPVWEKKHELGINGAFFDWSHYTMDSAAACNYLEELFINIQNSQWLPQWGFELWSIFYLMHQGMSLEKIKQFIAVFNLSIKQKLGDKTKKNLTPQMVKELEEICRF